MQPLPFLPLCSTFYVFTFLLCSLFPCSCLSSPQLDNDLLCLQNFLIHTSPSSALPWIFANSSNIQSPPCSLLQGPAMAPTSTVQVQCAYSSSHGERRITGLILERLKLHGSYPAGTLGNLSALSRLSLYDNKLVGSFPAELLRLSSLSYLSVAHNLFVGKVPTEFSSLSLLTRLDLSHNKLSGSIPVELGLLFKLRFLYLAANAFSQEFPAFLFSLPNLIDLNISSNMMLGTLSSLTSMSMAASPLATLDLSHNNLTGPLPDFKQFLRHLQHLDLRGNAFQDNISAVVMSLPESLTWVDLSSNMLAGEPTWISSQLPSLVHLDIANNALTPSSLQWATQFRHLQYLDLSHTHLVGIIPDDISALTDLVLLDLSYNELRGGLPSSLVRLQNITHLDLSNNNLSGDASVLLSLSRLSTFNYSFNNASDCDGIEAVRSKFGPDSLIGVCQPLPAASLAQNTGMHKRKPIAVIIGSAAVCVAIVLMTCVLAAGLLILRRRRKMYHAVFVAKRLSLELKQVSGPFSFETDSGAWTAKVKNPSSVPVVMFEKPLLDLTFADLLHATANFSKEVQLTEGGFGPVYKADLLGGLEVTIKVLIEGRVLTNQEAEAEFGVLARVKHANIVPLLGYCIIGEQKLVLYRYMENGGLHRWLHDLPIGMQLDDWSRDLQWEPAQAEVPAAGELGSWSRRHKIALGIARALSFLHHGHSPHIIHRDVKASNILLDEEFEPHLANTGLVGLLATNDEGLYAGSTPGYAPPEYRFPGSKVSTKGDVYSYGVVLLELVTGKRPFGDYNQDGFCGSLVVWVRHLMKEKRGHRALDPRISSEKSSICEMLEALRIACLCTAEAAGKRPSMQQVVGLLKDLEPTESSSA